LKGKPEKIVVNRKGKPYIRRYPKDYTTGEVHPNKLRSWLALAYSSTEKRGASLEDVVENVIRRMRGKTFRIPEPSERKEVTYAQYQSIILQALRKGIPLDVVDRLVVVKTETPEERKEVEGIKKLVKAHTQIARP